MKSWARKRAIGLYPKRTKRCKIGPKISQWHLSNIMSVLGHNQNQSSKYKMMPRCMVRHGSNSASASTLLLQATMYRLLHYRWLTLLHYRFYYTIGDKRYYIIGWTFITLSVITLLRHRSIITLSVIPWLHYRLLLHYRSLLHDRL